MFFPEWDIRLTDECETQKKTIPTQLINAIRAKAFHPRPARAVEKAEQDLEDFEGLIRNLVELQVNGRDPRSTMKRYKVRNRALYYYCLDSGPWRCYFRRDPVLRTALGMWIDRREPAKILQGTPFEITLW